jgi:hypothetical protein
MGANQGDGIGPGHLRQHVQEQSRRAGNSGTATVSASFPPPGTWLWRAPAELVRSEAAAGFARELGVGLGQRRRRFQAKEVRYLDIHEDDPLDQVQFAAWVKQASQLPGQRM